MRRYTLNAAMPVLLRPDGVVQVGWDPRRAVLVSPPEGVSAATLADVLRTRGNYAGAESLYREALAIRRKVLGPSHELSLQSLYWVGYTLHGQGKPREALASWPGEARARLAAGEALTRLEGALLISLSGDAETTEP